jgi:hypothetical protein
MNRSLLAGLTTLLAAFAIVTPAGAAPSVTTRTLIPRAQRTVGFNGYATYVFSAPKGSRIVSASAQIAGGESGAVVIQRRVISRSHTHFTVSLVFPGEQGTPGRLVIRLRSRD